MSFENPMPAAEKEPKFLSLVEVKAKIEQLCGQENPKVERVLEDERGVYLYEVTAVDDKGDVSLYSYRRVGDHAESKAANTLVDVAYFVGPIEDGMCVGGDTLSNYDEESEKWTDTR